MESNILHIIKLGCINGWVYIDHQENIKMLSFAKDGDRVNVYYSTMTVGTCINHHKQGKTQLFRKKVSMKMLMQIFKNPRVHTKTGYYKK